MNIPNTYADWVQILNLFKVKSSNDAEYIEAMKQGTIEWQTGVADRFYNKIVETLNTRTNAATDKFQKEMSRPGSDEYILIQAIISLRKELMLLTDMADLSAIPENYRTGLVKMMRDQADNVQKQLEDSAKKDRSGRLSSIIRNHKINNF